MYLANSWFRQCESVVNGQSSGLPELAFSQILGWKRRPLQYKGGYDPCRQLFLMGDTSSGSVEGDDIVDGVDTGWIRDRYRGKIEIQIEGYPRARTVVDELVTVQKHHATSVITVISSGSVMAIHLRTTCF